MKFYRLGYIATNGVNVLSKHLFTEAEKNEIEKSWTFQNAKGALYFELIQTKDSN